MTEAERLANFALATQGFIVMAEYPECDEPSNVGDIISDIIASEFGERVTGPLYVSAIATRAEFVAQAALLGKSPGPDRSDAKYFRLVAE